MIVRHASEIDCLALARLMEELGYPTTPDQIADRLKFFRDRIDHSIFVADDGGNVAGMIAVSVSPTIYRSELSGAIVALVVSSVSRGKGVAGLLVGEGERWLWKAGARRVMVNPSSYREEAHRVYTRLGFDQSGLRFTKNLVQP